MNLKFTRDLIKRHEGLRLKPYRCTAGKLTIGYGRNLDDIGISEHEADIMLEEDILKSAKVLLDIFGNDCETFIPKRKFSALTDMVFNLGETKFRQFKKMVVAIAKEDWDKAADEAKDSDWYEQVGVRGVKIVEILRETV